MQISTACQPPTITEQDHDHEGISKVENGRLQGRQKASLATPTDLTAKATKDIAGALNAILADVFALDLKTKNFHRHMSGPHFRDYHLLLDEQADHIYAMTDPIAERVRKTGASTLRSIGHIARLQRVSDNDSNTSSRAIPDGVNRVRLAGIMAVRNPPWAGHDSALAGGIRE